MNSMLSKLNIKFKDDWDGNPLGDIQPQPPRVAQWLA